MWGGSSKGVGPSQGGMDPPSRGWTPPKRRLHSPLLSMGAGGGRGRLPRRSVECGGEAQKKIPAPPPKKSCPPPPSECALTIAGGWWGRELAFFWGEGGKKEGGSEGGGQCGGVPPVSPLPQLTRPLLAPPQPLLDPLLEGGRLGLVREVQPRPALLGSQSALGTARGHAHHRRPRPPKRRPRPLSHRPPHAPKAAPGS